MRSAIAGLLKRGLLTAGYYRRALGRVELPGVAVLCYHGVRPDAMAPGTIPFQYLHIPVSTLDSHCRIIRDYCDPISLDDWRASLSGGPRLPKRPVLITFDDGYRSVLTMAAPVLAKYGVPAVVFVCTGPMATRRRLWFDEVAEQDGEDAVEAWKALDYDSWTSCAQTSALEESDPRALMTAAELVTLAGVDGFEIGGHTVQHPILGRASAGQQLEEIARNLRSITEWTGRSVRAFAYPNGRPGLDYGAETLAILRECGVDIAFTTRAAFAGPSEPALERSRFLVLDSLQAGELAHRLAHSWPR